MAASSKACISWTSKTPATPWNARWPTARPGRTSSPCWTSPPPTKGRRTMLDVVKARVADDRHRFLSPSAAHPRRRLGSGVLAAEPNKITVSSAAFRQPEVIAEMVKEFRRRPGNRGHTMWNRTRLCLPATRCTSMAGEQPRVPMPSNGRRRWMASASVSSLPTSKAG